MTVKRYICAWAVIAAVAILVIMTLNVNLDNAWINIVGLGGILFIKRYSSRLFPEWMREYLKPKEMDDRFYHN